MAKRSEIPQTPRPMPVPQPAPMVPEHERCPICFHGRGGRGHQYGQFKTKGRIYLMCNQCAHTWTADLKVEVVAIDHRLPPPIQER